MPATSGRRVSTFRGATHFLRQLILRQPAAQILIDLTDATHFLRNIPFVRRVARMIRGNSVRNSDVPKIEFSSSPSYWEECYRRGGSSGAGSYGRLARFVLSPLQLGFGSPYRFVGPR